MYYMLNNCVNSNPCYLHHMLNNCGDSNSYYFCRSLFAEIVPSLIMLFWFFYLWRIVFYYVKHGNNIEKGSWVFILNLMRNVLGAKDKG